MELTEGVEIEGTARLRDAARRIEEEKTKDILALGGQSESLWKLSVFSIIVPKIPVLWKPWPGLV